MDQRKTNEKRDQIDRHEHIKFFFIFFDCTITSLLHHTQSQELTHYSRSLQTHTRLQNVPPNNQRPFHTFSSVFYLFI